MLEVLMTRGSGEPDDEKVRTVEGWILGQKVSIYRLHHAHDSPKTGHKGQKEDSEKEGASKDQNSPAPTVTPARRLPRDRYLAPEMADWTKVFRFGHSILVPTSVNDSKDMLFGLDTGAFSNLLSVRAGRQVSKVSSEDRVRVRGVNGAVDKVYGSENATLRFGHFQQPNLGILTLDLSTISRHTGTEVSGFLGFAMLRQLEIELDYRACGFQVRPQAREPFLEIAKSLQNPSHRLGSIPSLLRTFDLTEHAINVVNDG